MPDGIVDLLALADLLTASTAQALLSGTSVAGSLVTTESLSLQTALLGDTALLSKSALLRDASLLAETALLTKTTRLVESALLAESTLSALAESLTLTWELLLLLSGKALALGTGKALTLGLLLAGQALTVRLVGRARQAMSLTMSARLGGLVVVLAGSSADCCTSSTGLGLGGEGGELALSVNAVLVTLQIVSHEQLVQ